MVENQTGEGGAEPVDPRSEWYKMSTIAGILGGRDPKEMTGREIADALSASLVRRLELGRQFLPPTSAADLGIFIR